MDTAKGSSIKELIEALPSDPALHVKAVQQLEAAVARVAEGLGELHQKFQSGEVMSKEAKRSDADHFLNRNFRDNGEDLQRVRAALGDDFERVKTQLEGPTLEAFYAANLPATAYHGDANAGNFIVGEYKGGYKDLGLIDVGSMSWSVADGATVGTRTGAADVARFLGSLESLAPGKLSEAEIVVLRRRFTETYFAQPGARNLDPSAYGAAEKWYRVEMEVAALRSDPTAKARILRLLGIGEIR